MSYVFLIKKNKPRVQILNVAYEKKVIITFSINKVFLRSEKSPLRIKIILVLAVEEILFLIFSSVRTVTVA